MKNEGIKAVNKDDIVNLLISLRVYEDVLSENKHCIFCNKVISVDNIDAILPVDNDVAFSCDNEECHLKLLLRIGEK